MEKNDDVGTSQNQKGDNLYQMVNNEEEKEEDLNKDLGEVVSKEPISSVVKKGIETVNVHNTKEG